MGEKNELEDTYALSVDTLNDAVKNIVSFMGMQPCERTDKVGEIKKFLLFVLNLPFDQVQVQVDWKSKAHCL